MGAPEPGLVIPFVYLWRREHDAGEESGRKIRPCLIIAVVRRSPSKVRVAVAPLATKVPDTKRSAIAIPARVGAHLGLDAAPSWVICDEYNEFDNMTASWRRSANAAVVSCVGCGGAKIYLSD